jgi:antitoxin component of MazEF toxin-antitoxin module
MELRKIHRGGEKKASYVLTLPQDYVKALELSEGDYVSLSVEEGRIVMVPIQERKQGEKANIVPSPARATSQATRLGESP